MKKLNILKIVQFIVMGVLSCIAIYLAFIDTSLFKELFINPIKFSVYILMWIVLILSFVFAFIDFRFLTNLKSNYNTLAKVAYADYISGIPNRLSCDLLLEKYSQTNAPIDIGCIMIHLTSLFEVNNKFGHSQGNELIKQFSTTLLESAKDLCFAGRNSGDKFIAIFKDCTQAKIDDFLQRLMHNIDEHNKEENAFQIQYKVGIALNKNERLKNLVDLIALANNRIYE